MRPFLRLAILALTLVSLLAPAVPARAADCQFVLGFKTLHDLIPNIVGNCVTDETHNGINGDALQQTTGTNGAGGLLVWRKADNWTAFTDGYHTWINGPMGVQERLNTQRFTWEADYAMVFALTISDVPTGYVVDDKDTGALTNAQLIADASNAAQEQNYIQTTGRIGGYHSRFYRSALNVSTEPGVISDTVNSYQTVQGAQTAWNLNWTLSPGKDWSSVSAPAVGDQSIAFTRSVTWTINSTSVPATEYLVRFRVGTYLCYVETAVLVSSADINQTVALAQIVVGRIHGHS